MTFKEEFAAVLRHIVIVGTLIAGAIGVGLLAEVGRKRIPSHAQEFGWIETIDTGVILILVSLFGAYMIGVVSADVWNAVRRAWVNQKGNGKTEHE